MSKIRALQPLLAIVAITLLVILSMRVSPGVTGEELEYRPLSLSEVTKAFGQSGLELEKVEDGRFLDVAFVGIVPEVYCLKDTEDLVFIYPFSSHGERKKLVGHFWRFDSGMIDMFTPYSLLFQTFEAKNMFVVYCPSVDIEILKPEELIHAPFNQRTKAIKKLFQDLNGVKTLVLRGEGQYWEVETVYYYCNQFYKDDRDVLGYDSWDEHSTMARYKGDASSVQIFDYSLVSNHGSSRGTGYSLRPDGTARLSGGGSRGAAVHTENSTYTFTVEWNGQRETFDLEIKPFGLRAFNHF